MIMRSSFIRPLLRRAGRGRSARLLLAVAMRLEGGQMTSRSLRDYLAGRYGVQAGDYSYGSLLIPGMSDRGLTIGSYVSIGPGVRRFGAAHPLERLSLHPYFYNPQLGLVGEDADVKRSDCRIGSDVWIGADALILPGCTRIGTGAVVGAGSVVTKDVTEFSIVVGNPARVIGERLSEQERDQVRQEAFWSRTPLDVLRDITRFTA